MAKPRHSSVRKIYAFRFPAGFFLLFFLYSFIAYEHEISYQNNGSLILLKRFTYTLATIVFRINIIKFALRYYFFALDVIVYFFCDYPLANTIQFIVVHILCI